MVDAAEVGKYGTLRLMKRNEPNASIASFPVDDEVVTFGRDPDCSVRLYYAWVSSIHCKIIFEENKAFLQVLGANGVVVDGCQVAPEANATTSPTTVPLINGSVIEIYKKRFQFTYPPKDLRPILLNTPHGKRRSSLRLSMIQSAHVFTPRPSPYPQENLRILQSPLKPFANTGGPDEVVKLVDGNHPKVVEEDQDLVILESIQSQAASRQVNFAGPSNAQPNGPTSPVFSPPVQPQPPRTPRRRSAPSLHRVVLLKSAQRAAEIMEAQRQAEEDMEANVATDIPSDQEEEEEVEEAVSAEFDDSDDSDDVDEDINPFMDGLEEHMTFAQPDVIMEEGGDEQDITEARFEHVEGPSEEVRHEVGSSQTHLFAKWQQPSTPVSKPSENRYRQFMTPQPKSILTNGTVSQGPQRPPPGGRFSLGGPGPQRVKIAEPWKVKDIVIEENPLKVEDERIEEAAAEEVADSKAIEFEVKVQDSEDVKSLLAKMKDTVASMRRRSLASRESLSSVGKGAPMTPSTKRQNEFSLLAPSPYISRLPGLKFGMKYLNHEDIVMEESGSQMALVAKEEEMVDPEKRSVKTIENAEEETVDIAEEGEMMNGIEVLDLVPKTPRMEGLKEMFRLPRAPPATPSFKGMREMFKEPRELHTPAFDGIRDMLATPEAPQQEEDIVDASTNDSIFESARQTRGRTGALTDTSTMADDEASPFDMGPFDLSKKVGADVPKGAYVRKGRSRTRKAASSDVEVAESEDAALPVRGRSAKARSTRTGSIRAESEPSEESSGADSARAVRTTARRGRAGKSPLPQIRESDDMLPNDEIAKETEIASSTVPARRAGARKLKEEITETEVDTHTTDSAPAAPRSRAKKAAAPKSRTIAKSSKVSRDEGSIADADLDVDPLDSIERPSSPEVQIAPAPQSRRGRSKAPAVTSISEEEQPRRKATRSRAVKSEPEEMDVDALSETSGAKTTKTTRKGPTSKQAAAKAAAALEQQNYGKENTPDATDESVDTKAVKAKAPRSRTTKATKAIVEDVAPPQRQTRARRVK